MCFIYRCSISSFCIHSIRTIFSTTWRIDWECIAVHGRTNESLTFCNKINCTIGSTVNDRSTHSLSFFFVVYYRMHFIILMCWSIEFYAQPILWQSGSLTRSSSIGALVHVTHTHTKKHWKCFQVMTPQCIALHPKEWYIFIHSSNDLYTWNRCRLKLDHTNS